MIDREAPTLITCPACEGAGNVCETVGTTRYRMHSCEVCRGTGCCTATEVKAWREKRAKG